jgi:hypothetical protein
MSKWFARATVALALVAGAVAACGQLMFYTSNEGRFSVQFPVGEVKQDTEQVNLKGGDTTTLHEFWVEQGEGNISYMVMYSDYPPDYANREPQQVLAGTRDGAVKNKTLLSDIEISLNGVPGREFTAKDDNWNYTVRQYLKGKRLYQLIVVSNHDHPAVFISDYLNSFKIF